MIRMPFTAPRSTFPLCPCASTGILTSELGSLGSQSMYHIKCLDKPDAEGRPVVYLRLGQLDLAELKKVGVTVPDIMRKHVRPQ
jgi:hypothetical protein